MNEWKTPKDIMGPKMKAIMDANAERAWRRENEPGYAEWHQEFVIKPSEEMDHQNGYEKTSYEKIDAAERHDKNRSLGTMKNGRTLHDIDMELSRACVSMPHGLRTNPLYDRAQRGFGAWFKAFQEGTQFGLLFLGPKGSGKTQALSTALRQVMFLRMMERPLRTMAVSPSLHYGKLGRVLWANKASELFDCDDASAARLAYAKEVKILCVDHMGAGSTKPKHSALLAKLIVERLMGGLPVVMASELTLEAFTAIYGQPLIDCLMAAGSIVQVLPRDLKKPLG